MCPMYTVKQGDYLIKIAKTHGLANWRRIYDDPQNANFRRQRPNPNLIYPGDQIYIPDKEPREEVCQTEQKHTFIVQRPKISLQISMLDEGDQGIPLVKYELKTDKKTYTRSMQDEDPGIREKLESGSVQEILTPDENAGELKVWHAVNGAEPDYIYKLKIGHLDPIDEIEGVQARLNNLGFDCGKVDGHKGPKTEAAIKAFQRKYGLEPDGKPGAAMQNKLAEIYGC